MPSPGRCGRTRRGASSISRTRPGGRIRIATALGESGVPLHPGAARYYAERGMELPPSR